MQLRQVVTELKQILESEQSDEDLGCLIEKLGSYYLPTKDVGANRAWLTKLLEEVSSKTQQ